MSSSFVFGQTKDELIKQMIDYNVLDSDCVGIACMPSEQFKRFEKLKTLISEEELLELSKHKKPIIRAYASQELINRDAKYILQIFPFEIDKNEMVETQDGCLGGFDDLSWLVYNSYRWKIASAAITKSDTVDNIRNAKIEKALADDKTFQSLNYIILYSGKDLSYLLYRSILEDNKLDSNLLPRIKDLAFKYNNSYAFDCISDKYPEEVEKYFEKYFLKANFNSRNKVMYLDRFVEYLLDSKNEKYKNLVIRKLKKDNSWKKHVSWIEQKLEKHKIVL